MQLNPARRAGDVLPVVLRAPTFHKTHPYCTHFGELVDSLEAVVDWLAEQLGELLVVEDLEAASGRDFTDSGRVEVMVIVAVAALHKYAAVTETFGKHLASDIIQVDTWNRVHQELKIHLPEIIVPILDV